MPTTAQRAEFGFILKEARAYRSRERVYVISTRAHEPGDIMEVIRVPGNTYAVPPPVAALTNAILAERYRGPGAQLKLLITKHAELNDQYINYWPHGTVGGRDECNAALAANSHLIVRPAIWDEAPFAITPPPRDDPPAADILPVPVEPPPSPLTALGAQAWAILLVWRRWFVAVGVRWGRRR